MLSILFVVSSALDSEGSKKAETMLERADKAMEAKNYPAAEEFYLRARSEASAPLYEVEDGISRAFVLQGRFDKGLEASRSALALTADPVEQAKALNRIGMLLYETAHAKTGGAAMLMVEERLEEAEAVLRRSLEISDGRFALAWFNLAEVLYAQERHEEAKAAVDRHLELTPPEYLLPRATFLKVCLEELTDSAGGIGIARFKDGAVAKPRRVSGQNPVYTEAARMSRIQGVVIVESVITDEGNLVCTKVLKGLPLGLSRAATSAMSTWKFEPAELNGEPVSVFYNLTVSFRLEKTSKETLPAPDP